jgi:hypothetical protein
MCGDHTTHNLTCHSPQVSGTDIVRALHFRFAAFGRPVRNAKKFEEGIFSDLRNLKSGSDATLEEPKVNDFECFHPFMYDEAVVLLDCFN